MEKKHFKMYKSGKAWVVAGITVWGLVIAGGGISSQTVQAATDTATTAVAAADKPASGAEVDTEVAPASETETVPAATDAQAPAVTPAEAPAPANDTVAETQAKQPAATEQTAKVATAPAAATKRAMAQAPAAPAAKTSATVTTDETVDAATKALTDQATAALAKAGVSFDQIHYGLATDITTTKAVADLHGAAVTTLNANGYLLKAGTIGKQTVLAVQGTDATGLFYALNDLINRTQAKQDLSHVDVYESPQMSIRGVIEGFYGQPWSDQARKELFAFMGEHRMNTYIYSPKDDNYLRKNWRDLYPDDALATIKSLVDEANRNHVSFVYTLSPGNDITYSSQADYEATVAKFNQLRSIGVTQFYIALDDIPLSVTPADQAKFPAHATPNYPYNQWSTLADAQSYYLNRLEREYIQVNQLPDLWLVPTNYNGSARDPFKEAQGQSLDSNIRMQWTGEGVFSGTLSADSITKAKETYNTEHMFIWDNFPVNDSNQDRLYLNPVSGRADDLYQVTDGFTANPMIEPYASWIGIGSFADYMWNAGQYDPQQSLYHVLKEIAGTDPAKLAALQAFVDLNQDWNYAPADQRVQAPLLAGLFADYQNTKFGTPAYQKALAALQQHLELIVNAPTTLKTIAVSGFYDDALPWINAASHWAKATLAGITIMDETQKAEASEAKIGASYQTMAAEITAAQAKAVPNSRTGKPDPVITPTVGDGQFKVALSAAYQALDQWLQLTPIKSEATQLTGTASTNISQYEGNGAANMADGDASTKFWSSRNVAKGDTLTLNLGQVESVQRVILHQGTSDAATSGDLFTSAIVYAGTKADGSDKVVIGHVTATGLYQLDLSRPVEAQYLFVVADAPTDSWLQIREFSAYSGTGLALDNVESATGQAVQNVFDGTTETTFTPQLTDPTQGGVIEQNFTTPLTGMHSVVVVGQVPGTVAVKVGDTWQTIGTTDGKQLITRLAINFDEVAGIRLTLAPVAKAGVLAELGLSKLEVKATPTPSDESQPSGEPTPKPSTETGKPSIVTAKNQPGKPTVSAHHNGQRQGKRALPKTGEAINPALVGLGALLAGLSGLSLRRREH